jgi:hypothetical protein
MCVANGDNAQARVALQTMRRLAPQRMHDRLLAVLAHLPFAAAVVGGIRRIRSLPAKLNHKLRQ